MTVNQTVRTAENLFDTKYYRVESQGLLQGICYDKNILLLEKITDSAKSPFWKVHGLPQHRQYAFFSVEDSFCFTTSSKNPWRRI
jgi:hypothetical protein